VKTIILTLSAAKDLDALPRDAREQVEAGLHRYAMMGQGDVKSLQGRDGYRLRIGSYRVIFDEDATTILAIYIGRRATTTYKRSYGNERTPDHSDDQRRRAGGAAPGRI
jgi:mRNA interferase RelE/StbE